ncbi:hypothetical protein [Mycobacterium sp. GA-2829]|nr:hypothetical protein [Mycobacterium sp. GA-2829]
MASTAAPTVAATEADDFAKTDVVVNLLTMETAAAPIEYDDR